MPKLNLSAIKAAPTRSGRYTLWDSELKGFGVRVNVDGTKTYLLKYVFSGRQRWHTIGRHGSPWTPETARLEALKLLRSARSGLDPAEERRRSAAQTVTVSQLCDQYLAAARAGQLLTKFDEPKKASTLVTDASRIERHIKPLLGSKRVRDVTPDDIEAFLHDVASGKTAADVKTRSRGRAIVKGGRGTATRTVGLLGSILSFAVKRRLRTDNPVRGVQRFKDRRNERFLSDAEMQRLGAVLNESEAVWTAYGEEHADWLRRGKVGPSPRLASNAEDPFAIAALRMLLLTGARKSEVLKLRWQEVDLEHGYLRLEASKTGMKVVPLGQAALQVLMDLPRIEHNPYVFVGSRPGQPLVGLPKIWERIRRRANIEDCRLHDLRHSFASAGAAAGSSLLLIGALLGHRDPKTTLRYAHVAYDPAKAAADQISGRIAMRISK